MSVQNKTWKNGKKAYTYDGICQHCGEYFVALHQHILRKHETNKAWKCDECDWSHASPQALKVHKYHKHPNKDSFKVCQICGYKSVSNNSLKLHIKAVHEKIYEHTCNTCQKQFFSKTLLNRHIRVVHLGERNFKCHICNMAFKENSETKLHIQKVHEGIKFECLQCKKEFRGNCELSRHNRKFHAD